MEKTSTVFVTTVEVFLFFSLYLISFHDNRGSFTQIVLGGAKSLYKGTTTANVLLQIDRVFSAIEKVNNYVECFPIYRNKSYG